MKFRGVLIVIAFFLYSCSGNWDLDKSTNLSDTALPTLNKQLTNVIIADIFTPPVASRIYAYSNIAAYEALQPFDSTFISFSGQLNGLEELPRPVNADDIYPPLAAVAAFTTVSARLVYSEEKIIAIREDLIQQFKETGIPENIQVSSIEFGTQVGNHIVEWASKDGYKERTSLGAYQIPEDISKWQPTGPDFMEAIEPHWSTLRTFVIDSASQFNPGGPTSFDTAANSDFYKGALDVYNIVNSGTPEKLEIAQFWDCNPNISYTQGHVMMYRQQNSPGGHWVHIAAEVVEAENLNPMEQANTFTLTCITLADAFISCWQEKYNSDLIRPQTYINNYIDSTWNPILQTPAFPEHTSGHSVASASAATVLSHLFGDNYAFTDSTEVPFGLPARNFNSFYEASEEAAISRFYGGIHYMPAITLGVNQGKELAGYVLKKVKTHP